MLVGSQISPVARMAPGVTGTAPPSREVPRATGGIAIGPAVGECGGVVGGGGEQGGFYVKPLTGKVAEEKGAHRGDVRWTVRRSLLPLRE